MIGKLRKLIPQRHPIRYTWSRIKGLIAALQYGFPARKLTVIAITGTDGKTTTVGMTAHILHQTGKKVGASSTAFLQKGEEKKVNDTHLTSIDPFSLQKFLRELVIEGYTHVVIETSSHALVQGRTAFTWPVVAAVTNVSPEHLDYHGTMTQYTKDKGIIFRMLRGKGVKVLNQADDSFALYNAISSRKTLTYNTDESNLSVQNIQAEGSSVSADLLIAQHDSTKLSLSIPGIYNLENAQCAIACAMSIGISPYDATAALKDFETMPGRLEEINEGQNFHVFVDFTMTENGYEQALKALRAIVGDDKRVLVLGSCCGNRMKEKRTEIGRICSEYADVVCICEDETYGEDPHKVQEEVWSGVDQSKTDAHKIFDRREAITFLFNNAQAGDAVVLCGMGPFDTMNTLNGPREWDERKVAREILQSL